MQNNTPKTEKATSGSSASAKKKNGVQRTKKTNAVKNNGHRQKKNTAAKENPPAEKTKNKAAKQTGEPKNKTSKQVAEPKKNPVQPQIPAEKAPEKAPEKNAAGKKNPWRRKNVTKKTKTKKQDDKAIGLGLYESIPARAFGKTNAVKIAFLGGINEIGKNLTLFEYGNEIIILDSGMSFPDADMPGIDYVLPDISYVERNASRIKAIFITHGHEDHIGGLPYLLKSVKAPVYCTCLTAGLIRGKLKEHRMLNTCNLCVIKPGDVIDTGAFSVEAIHVNHSIPDSLAFAIKCGAGTIVHTGDFKIDNTPIDGGVIDLARFAALGNEGVLCLMSDSTNAERSGYTPSEKNVGETLESLFVKAQGKRIIVASFASNIHRIQQIITASEKMGRKVFLSGRSLENVTSVSMELGYLNIPDGIMKPIDHLKNYRDEETVIITTGSQGEPMSALSRMALSDHRKVSVGSNDFIIISATPIPGNEKTVANTINELMKLGAEVVYEKNLGIHVSGHAAQEEQKLIMNLVRPRFFVPVHGEQKHLRRHAATALSVGIPDENILIPELGSVIEVSEERIGFAGTVPAGRVFIDSSGVSDVGNTVLSDRKKLSTDGIVMITAVTDAYTGELAVPVEVQSRGFVFMDNANRFNDFINDACARVFEDYALSANMDIAALKAKVRDTVSRLIYDKTRRNPIIVVTVIAV